ncbi:hypothetical protein [Salinispora vitiensis]|uniref:hypothetical protein n=1 Tax=Salinispora vitiensis TaxID=999544 RepID=UPI00037B98BE|nr:hypothetical protein [Salinispora vitiensis]
MSQYDIRRSCGHTETINIRGPNTKGQREDKARWLAEHPCHDCVRAERQQQRAALTARALTLAKAAGWPDITDGTPRQVSAAIEARATMVAEIVARVCDPPRELGFAGILGEEDYRHAGHPRAEDIAGIYVAAALRVTDPKWWLDRRDLGRQIRNAVDLVEEAGVARRTYGGLLAAIETTFTEDDRQHLATLTTGPS